jgi:hydrogenase large subunit
VAKIVINPLTRISGFLEIEVYIENNIIVDAKSSGNLFRGFENMLNGRNPLDAIYFTQRICGICSAAHAVASSMALEDAFKVTPIAQGIYLRDLVHSCEFLQNHLRHFYLYSIPDFVILPQNQCLFETQYNDFRLPKKINDKIAEHYFEAINYSRQAHQMLAIFGGKAPHEHGIFVGGLNVWPTIDKIVKFKSILKNIKAFVNEKVMPDVCTIGEYYDDYFYIGGGYGNLLSYGLFDNFKALPDLYVSPSVLINNQKQTLNKDKIVEYITYSWYEGEAAEPPNTGITLPDLNKEKGYSWVKAPRYEGFPCEVGPLARMILSGDYHNGVSAMDRMIARVLEIGKIIGVMEELLDVIELNLIDQEVYQTPQNAQGVGLTDTTRGALGHWLKIDKKVISHYQVVTPSGWNLAPRDQDGQLGVLEKALIGTFIEDMERPAAIGRIVRSFDPCVSCATHVYTPKGKKTINVR